MVEGVGLLWAGGGVLPAVPQAVPRSGPLPGPVRPRTHSPAGRLMSGGRAGAGSTPGLRQLQLAGVREASGLPFPEMGRPRTRLIAEVPG